jgi:hypothetical protein
MTWHTGSTRMVVWQLLRLNPLTAAQTKAALPKAKSRAVDQALYLLKQDGYAELLDDGRYRLTASRPPVPEEVDQVAAVDLVEDCPGGIDEWLLSSELKVRPNRVRALLAEPILQQRVRRIELPGGVIRYLPTGAAA